MEKLLATTNLDVQVSVEGPLSSTELHSMHACRRACNYLSVGMIVDWTWPF